MKRPQRQKATVEHIRFVQELRRSNAAVPVPAKDRENERYRKYGIDVFIEDDTDDEDNPYLWS